MRKMAEYDEEEYIEEEVQEDEHQEHHDGDALDELYGSSVNGGGSTFRYIFIAALITVAVWQYFKISNLNIELKRASNEKMGTEQTLNEQKTKTNSKEQTISQLESQVTILEKKLNDAKSAVAAAEGRAGSSSGELSDLRAKVAEAQANAEKYKATAEQAVAASSKGGDYDSLFKAEDLKVVTFKGAKRHPNGSGKLIWSQKLGVVYLNIFNLDKNPDGKEYQLWGNEGDKFFSVGTFAIDDTKKGSIKLAAPADLGTKKISDFVITVEKKGGSEKLTRPYYLTGSLFQNL